MAKRVYACEESRFLGDVSEHTMKILRDDGLYRHIRFKRETSGTYWFDILTWSGNLMITGDCGTWVFNRIEDMFEFFRTTPNDWNFNKEGGLSINPQYWAEKLTAVSNNGGRYGKSGAMEFSEEKFQEAIKYRFDSHFEDEVAEDASILSDATEEDPLDAKTLAGIAERKRERDDLWDEIEDHIFGEGSDEHALMQAAYDFEYKGKQFFQDFWESNHHDYTFQYIWCLYAIVWGIQKYDNAKVVTLKFDQA